MTTLEEEGRVLRESCGAGQVGEGAGSVADWSGWTAQAEFTKTVLETALNEEMTDHLGHDKNQAPPERDSTNIRNGTRPKMVLTGEHVPIEVPRDREETFEPQITSEAPTPIERGRRDHVVAQRQRINNRCDLAHFALHLTQPRPRAVQTSRWPK